MMPHTVPNSPTKGAVEPTVARYAMKRSTRSISRPTVVHHPFDALLEAGAHDCGAEQSLGGAAPPFPHGRREHRAHRIDGPRAEPVEEIVKRAARPEGFLEAGRGRL